MAKQKDDYATMVSPDSHAMAVHDGRTGSRGWAKLEARQQQFLQWCALSCIIAMLLRVLVYHLIVTYLIYFQHHSLGSKPLYTLADTAAMRAVDVLSS